MTNLQEASSRNQQLMQQRLLLGVPIALGAVLAIGVGSALGVPQWLQLRSDMEEVDNLRAMKREIQPLKQQLAKLSLDTERADKRQRKILALIQGSGEFSTFLAQIDREATGTGIQLGLYEPVAVQPPAAATTKNKKGQGEPPPPPKDPMVRAGLQAQQVLLSARGRYPNLLEFTGMLEKLSLLVIPSNLTLNVVDSKVGEETVKLTEMKLALSYYTVPDGGIKPVLEPVAADKTSN